MTALTEVKENSWKTYVVIFLIYSTLMSIGEHAAYYFSKKTKILANPIMEGFPMYGIGAYLLILIFRGLEKLWTTETANRLLNSLVFQFILSATILTLIEYIGGRIVGAGKTDGNGHIRAWDYSETFLNFQGIINLQHFILHGVLGIVLLKIHPVLVKAVNRIFEF